MCFSKRGFKVFQVLLDRLNLRRDNSLTNYRITIKRRRVYRGDVGGRRHRTGPSRRSVPAPAAALSPAPASRRGYIFSAGITNISIFISFHSLLRAVDLRQPPARKLRFITYIKYTSKYGLCPNFLNMHIRVIKSNQCYF